MKKFSKKGGLLFAAGMAICAFAMPSIASAASWGVVGSSHTLDSPNLGFSSPSSGLLASCTNSSFSSTVANSANLTITTGAFAGCTSSLAAAGADCTATFTATRFPWRITPGSTFIQIHDIDIDVTLEHLPGRPGSCGILFHIPFTIFGTLSIGHWTGNGANQHEIVWSNGTGLTNQAGSPVSFFGTLRDTQQTLIVTG